jgi:hypothetical protein
MITGEMKGGYFPGFEPFGMFNMEAKGFENISFFWFETSISPSFAYFGISKAYFYPWAGLFYGKAGPVE